MLTEKIADLISHPAAWRGDELIYRPDWIFHFDGESINAGNSKPWCRQPVFSFFEGHFAANLLRVLIERAHAHPELPALSDIQREALNFLEEVADRPELHVTFMQEPGDMLFLNNWITLHRRSEFEDFDDPAKKRHLMRIWLSVPNSRPIHPDFAGNYGAIG